MDIDENAPGNISQQGVLGREVGAKKPITEVDSRILRK